VAQLLRVPEVAAGATEVVLSEWLVVEGAEASAGEPVAVVETDKATVEVESDASGVLLRTLVSPGAVVAVGAPMALVGTRADVGEEDRLLAELGVEASAPQQPAALRRDVPAEEAESPTPGADVVPTAPEPAESAARSGAPRRIFISPLARKLLKQAGLAPEDVHGTGPHGRITRRDADAAIAAQQEAPAPAAPAAPAPGPAPDVAGEREPHTRLRRAVAARLTQSKRDVPHFYLKRTALIDDLLAFRAQVNAHASVKVSVNDLLVRAVGLAHVAVPEVNAIWTEDATVRLPSVDVAVAVASERGLVTPVVRDVPDRTLTSISGAVRDLAQRADAGRLQQSELEGGSITVTNLGMYGVEEFAAIINPPQSCILAVGAGRQAPVVRDGELAVATQLGLVMSVDHRVIDGALAARWLGALVELLEQPIRLVV
jgi:pyruvate dehydrogenase E2 component (dihydrolipoamide acetyltransferase)